MDEGQRLSRGYTGFKIERAEGGTYQIHRQKWTPEWQVVFETDDPDELWHAAPPERILLEDAWVLPPDDLVD